MHPPSLTSKPNKSLRFVALTILVALGLPAPAAEITVSAAASLTNALKDVIPLFEAAHPGAKVLTNFAASGLLLQQIVKGAPVDVFASADQETMDQAQAQGFAQTEQRRNFVSNTLVLIVPSTAKAVPSNLRALTGPEFQRIAIGIPASVPAGRYTKAALEAEGLWSAIEPKTIGAQNVRQALDYVSRAEVDAGFVYATDAAQAVGKVKLVFTVTSSKPVLYPAAPIMGSANAMLARKFVEFLTMPAAQAVFARHGFSKP